MPRLSAAPLTLSETEKTDLERLLRRSSTPQQIALRAKIILRASGGEGHGEISRGLGITKDTSRLWRNRWIELSAVGSRILDIRKELSLTLLEM
jgi:putative transposase